MNIVSGILDCLLLGTNLTEWGVDILFWTSLFHEAFYKMWGYWRRRAIMYVNLQSEGFGDKWMNREDM